MGVQRFFDRSIIVMRLKDTSGGRETFQSTATVDGTIQELDQRSAQLIDAVNERAWKAYFPDGTDIDVKDRLTDPDGKTYEVREITAKNYGGSINRHLQVIMVELTT